MKILVINFTHFYFISDTSYKSLMNYVWNVGESVDKNQPFLSLLSKLLLILYTL